MTEEKGTDREKERLTTERKSVVSLRKEKRLKDRNGEKKIRHCCLWL